VLVGYGSRSPRGRSALGRTRLGAGLLAFARAALPGGRAEDVVAWLRTPGGCGARAADALEAAVRRRGIESARTARACGRPSWEASHLTALDELRVAADPATWPSGEARRAACRRGGLSRAACPGRTPAEPFPAGAVPFLTALAAEAGRILAAPHYARPRSWVRRTPPTRAWPATGGALSELRGLADAAPELLGDPGRAARDARRGAGRGGSGAPGGVLCADPLAIRARRFRAVFVCGPAGRRVPAPPVPEPFLDDARARAGARRRARAAAPRGRAGRERYLFYACVSRPEEVLFLSFRSSDEEGDPQAASPFVDDVRALFTDELWEQRGRRLLAEVTWPPAEAPTPHELRARRRPPSRRRARRRWRARRRRRCSRARGARPRVRPRLETFAACGVRWLVERVLKPERADADPSRCAAARSPSRARAHAARLRERTGSAR
jgi:hypothetical protein